MPSNKELAEQLAEAKTLLTAAAGHAQADRARIATLEAEHRQATAMLTSTGEKLAAFESWCQARAPGAHGGLVAIMSGEAPPDLVFVKVDAKNVPGMIPVSTEGIADWVDWARDAAPHALREFLQRTGLQDVSEAPPEPYATPAPGGGVQRGRQ